MCRSLQRIAEHAQRTVQIGDFFHDVVIPRLLGLSLQAALHCKCFNCSFLPKYFKTYPPLRVPVGQYVHTHISCFTIIPNMTMRVT